METPAFDQLVALLGSVKARQRTEGLDLLEITGAAELNSRQFGALTCALVKLIATEKKTFISSQTGAVEDRLIRAALVLRSLVSKAINGEKIIRVKHYVHLVLCLPSFLFHTDTSIFIPLGIHVARILSLMLRQAFIKDHLLEKEWLKVYKALIKAVRVGSENNGSALVLAEICLCVSHILYASSHHDVTVSYFLVEDAYLELLAPLRRVVEIHKEEILAISVLQIIIKTVVIISTENTAFAKELVSVGLLLVASHIEISTRELQLQICIFLNLEAVRLLASVPSTMETERLMSQSTTRYTVGSIIHHMMPKLATYDYLLPVEEIGFKLPNKTHSFFAAHGMYLKNDAHDIQPWLITKALGLLSHTFFEIEHNAGDSPEICHESKRRKLTSAYINGSGSAIEYFTKLVESSDRRLQKSALLVLAFHIDTAGRLVDPNPALAVALKMIKISEFKEHAMLVVKAVLAHLVIYSPEPRLLTLLCNQILCISLTSVRDLTTSAISCEIIYLLSCTDLLKVRLNTDSTNQIKSLIALSEINGPSSPNASSFRFWYALQSFVSEFDFDSSSILGQRVQAWLLERWDSFLVSSSCEVAEAVDFASWLCGCKIRQRKARIPHDLLQALSSLGRLQHQSLGPLKYILSIDQEKKGSKEYYVALLLGGSNSEELVSHIISTELAHPSSVPLWYIFTSQLAGSLEASAVESALCTSLRYYSDSLLVREKLCLMDFDSIRNLSLNTQWLILASTLKRLGNLLSIESICSNYTTSRKADGLGRRHEHGKVIEDQQFRVYYVADLLVQLGTAGDSSFLALCFEHLEQLQPEEFSTAISRVFLLSSGLLIDNVSASTASRITRSIGERLLADEKYERLESTYITVARSMLFLIADTKLKNHSEIRKDCEDICLWYMKCFEMGLIHSQNSTIEFVRLMETMMTGAMEKLWSTKELGDIILSNFSTSNYVLFHVAETLARLCLIGNLSYQAIIAGVPSPQRSHESSASFVYLLQFLGVLSYYTLGAVTYSLAELAMFQTSFSLVLIGLDYLCRKWNIHNRHQLFKLFELGILKTYLLQGLPIDHFPFRTFGFESLESFVQSAQRVLVALALSMNFEDTSVLLSKVASITGFSNAELIRDSIALASAYAFTKGGIRNDIFTSNMIAKEQLTKLFQDQLLNTILAVIEHTSVSDENVIRSVLKKGTRADSLFKQLNGVLEDGNKAVISLTSAVQLVPQCVKKYSEGQFWLLQNVYFLVRRLYVQMCDFLFIKRSLLFLRRIKLLLALADAEPFDSLKLLILKMCNHLISEPRSHAEIEGLLIWCDLGAVSTLGNKIFTNEIFLLLGSQLKHGMALSLTLKAALQAFEDFSNDEGTRTLVRYAIQASSAPNTELLGSKLELSMHQCLSHNLDKDAVFCLIDQLQRFNKLKEPPRIYSSIFLALLSVTRTEFTEEFKLWATKYLAEVYLQNQLDDCAATGREERTYSMFFDDFEKCVSSMAFAISAALKYISDENPSIAAAAEIFVGGILWRNDLLAKMVPEVQRLNSYIKPVDFGAAAQLYPESLDSDFKSVISLHLLQLSNFETWSASVLSYVLERLAQVNTCAPLLAMLSKKVSHFATDVLPHLLLFYVYSYESGKEDVASLLSTVCGSLEYASTASNEKFSKLMSTLVLLIRAGHHKKVSPFPQLYEKLDKVTIYLYFVESCMAKTALLLFEDLDRDDLKRMEVNRLEEVYAHLEYEDILADILGYSNLGSASCYFGEPGSNEKFQLGTGILDVSTILSKPLEQNMKQSFVEAGYLGLAKLIKRGTDSHAIADYETDFEWSWKLNSWSLPVLELQLEHATIYRVLKCLRQDPSETEKICNSNMVSLWNSRPLWNKNTNQDKQVQTWLRILATMKGVEDVSDPHIEAIDKFSVATKWFENSESDASENIILSRFVTLMQQQQPLIETPKENLILQATVHELCRFISLARINNRSPQIIRATILLESMVKGWELLDKVNLERLASFQSARSLWSQGKTQVPIAMVKTLAHQDIDTPFRGTRYSKAYMTSVLASWMALSKQALPAQIMTDYVEPAAKQAHLGDTRAGKIFSTFGSFCEAESRSAVVDQDVQKLERQIASKKKEIDELKEHYGKTAVSAQEKKSVQRYYSKLKSLYAADVENLSATKKQRGLFSRKAAQFYLWSMLAQDDTSAESDSFFSAWLKLIDEDGLSQELANDITQIPSYQLVGWSSQLMSRLSTESTSFQAAISGLVFRLCRDHPFHSIYGLISLRKHEQFAKGSENPTMLPKIKAANDIWLRLQAVNDHTSELQRWADELADNCVKLAEHKVKRGRSVNLLALPVGHYWLERLPRIPPPAVFIPIDRTCKYEDAVHMQSIDHEITVAASGLSLPKIAKFLLSDGTHHRALFKAGTDDLRQDSIMEQVFEKVNSILKKDPNARKRRLVVRTYKAVPLGPQAGVIEFVSNSLALIDTVKPYHAQHDRLKADKAREQMKACQYSSNSERIEVFRSICSKVRPVLRQYFAETFLDLEAWLDTRVNYTRGVATTSIVGFVVGLGDRHCNNILLDQQTGEPIHIDLGVAFDQGKKLPIPETVPFRLTRDIVDGFGVSGVNGVFRNSCEHTYRVMQLHSDHILAILDVLRWDPLCTWSLSPIRKKHLQEEAEVGTAKLQPLDEISEAGTAISTVAEKLAGKGLSVAATVQTLMNEAMNDENLALIYCGWCPFY